MLLCVSLTGSWTPSETGIKRLRMRYAELITLLIVFKSTVDMNKNSFKK